MQLIHIKIKPKLKEQMQKLIDEGLFNNYSEIVREGIRDILKESHHPKPKK